MQRPPIIPTLLFCLVTIVIYKYNNVNYALFLCSLGRLTHCRSQFSLFLPVLRFASSATGGAQLRTSTVRLNVGVCTVPKCSPARELASRRFDWRGTTCGTWQLRVVPLSSAHYIRSHFPRKRGQLMGVRHCVNSPLRCIPHSGRSASAPSPANRIGLRCKKLEIDPGSAHKVVARWRRGACLQLPVLELLRFAASSTGRAQLRNVAG